MQGDNEIHGQAPPQRSPGQQGQTPAQMGLRRSQWEPCWGPVFKNKEQFVEMHLC